MSASPFSRQKENSADKNWRQKFDVTELNNGIKSILNFNAENVYVRKVSLFFSFTANLAISPVLRVLCMNAVVAGWRFRSCWLLFVLLSLLLTWWKRDFMGYSFDLEWESKKRKKNGIYWKWRRSTILNVSRIFMLFAWILLLHVTYYMMAFYSCTGMYCKCGNFPFPNSNSSKSEVIFSFLLFHMNVSVSVVFTGCSLRSISFNKIEQNA